MQFSPKILQMDWAIGRLKLGTLGLKMKPKTIFFKTIRFLKHSGPLGFLITCLTSLLSLLLLILLNIWLLALSLLWNNHSTIKIALTIVKLLQIYFVKLVFLLQFGKVLSKRIVDCFLWLKGHYNILSAELKIALTQW